MKLIYLSNARMPTEKAHGIHLMKMCENFAKLTEVELVIPRRFNLIKENPFDYYGVARVFKITKIPCLDLIPLDKYIGKVSLWIELATFSFFAFCYLLFKKTDILYIRGEFFLPLGLLKKKSIFEAHTFWRHRFFYFPFLRRMRTIVVITRQLKDLFVKYGIDEDKILVAPDGVDLDEFNVKDTEQDCRRKLNLPLDKKIVLYTGHLYQWKGAQILAEASQFLPEDAEVYFVGGTTDDVEKFKIKNLKATLRGVPMGSSKIQVVGHRPYREIAYWLKAADVLVLPNSGKEDISKYWTSPLKMFEYMASEKPIVASGLLSIREILNEENSILVEPDDPRALAGGIEKVLQDAQLSDKISAKAFEDVQQYAWQKRADKILKFFQRK